MKSQPPDFPQLLAAYFADRLEKQNPQLVASIRALVQAGHHDRVEAIADTCGNAPLAMAIKFTVIKIKKDPKGFQNL